jgi:hypothetical protein
VGWWPFNGNANDESGNGNDGTVNGATLTTDRFGATNSAYSFQSGNYIEVINNESISLASTDFTITSWVFLTDTLPNPVPYGNYMIISKRDFSNNTYDYFFGVTAPSNTVSYGAGKPAFATSNNTGSFNVAPNPIAIGQWSLLSAVYILNTGTLELYENGQLVSSVANIPEPSAIVTVNLWIGNDVAGSPYNFHGNIDDIAIWNRALTPQEITALYTATNTTNNNQTANTTANVPGAISYQAVARDAQGAPLADTNVQVRFTLIADSLSGVEEYVETHTLSTNSLGLFTTAFGAGTPVSSTFGNINWSAGHKFLNVKIDTGNGLVDIGTQQLLSTPYSLYSAKAGEIKNPGLPVFSDNAAALGGGLVAGQMYRTATGDLKIVY